MALWVEFFALCDGVEDAEKGHGVGSAAGTPLPAKGVVGEIGVNEGVPEPASAVLPGLECVFD